MTSHRRLQIPLDLVGGEEAGTVACIYQTDSCIARVHVGLWQVGILEIGQMCSMENGKEGEVCSTELLGQLARTHIVLRIDDVQHELHVSRVIDDLEKQTNYEISVHRAHLPATRCVAVDCLLRGTA